MYVNGLLLWITLPTLLALVAIEYVLLRRKGQAYTLREGAASIVVGIGYKLSGLVTVVATTAIALFVWEHRIATLPLNNAWGIVALFFAVEFAYYWFHRLSHEIRWMWASHAVHHTPEHLNILASIRLSWTGPFSGGFLVYLPLMFIGFHPAAVALTLGLNLLYQSWVHTELIPKLGWLEYVLNTPSNHRVHHASNADYLDRNYGGVLIVFDRLFGTYAEERADEPPRYGLVKPLNSTNPFWIAFHEWVGMFRDVRNAKRLRDLPGHLFGRPGWRPAADTGPALPREPAAVPVRQNA